MDLPDIGPEKLNSGPQFRAGGTNPAAGGFLSTGRHLPPCRPARSRSVHMGELKDKAKGLTNEAAGNLKQGIGKVTGNEKLRAEGMMQERKGEAQQLAGKIKGAAGNKV
jgi:uncharacterized protein YjbJ (UPF0337 family)